MRLSADELKVCQTIARQYPEFVELLNRLRTDELEVLPFATNNLDVMRGRVQALTEMQGHFKLR